MSNLATITHFGDPCIHCGIAHDNVPVGPCTGDRTKAIVIRYCITRQGWQNNSGAQTVIRLMSDGTTEMVGTHNPSFWRSPEYARATPEPVATCRWARL